MAYLQLQRTAAPYGVGESVTGDIVLPANIVEGELLVVHPQIAGARS